MTNSEQAIREFAEKQHPENWEYAAQSLFNQIQRSSQAKCLSDLTALISEHYYPKEFVEWKDKNVMRCYGGWMFNYGHIIEPRFKSNDELFNYWKENER